MQGAHIMLMEFSTTIGRRPLFRDGKENAARGETRSGVSKALASVKMEICGVKFWQEQCCVGPSKGK